MGGGSVEPSHFDRLTKSLTEAGTRRRLLGVLATVPVLGGLAEALDEASAKTGKGKRSRRRRDAHGLTQERRGKGGKKGKKKKKKRGGQGTTAPPSTTLPPGGETCDDLAFAECFAPWLNEWDERVGGCAEACDAGANAACEECIDAAITPLVEPFSQCFAQACAGAPRNARARTARAQVAAAPAACNPVELNRCQTRWMAEWTLVNVVAGQALGVPAMLAGIATQTGSLVLDTCNERFGCPGNYQCHTYPGRSEGVCCAPCHRYDPGSQSCVAACAADEACNAFGQCRKTCKQCYDYLVNGRQMPCGQITNNCGTILTCNGCASTERCQNRRCVPETCVSGRGIAAADECCLPQTCEELGKSCGEWEDGCGGVLDCGPECGCVPFTCDPEFPTCNLDDGCGGKLNCCPPEMICNTTDYDWDLCCLPAPCDPVQGWGGACVFDECVQLCRLCGEATIESCSGGNPNAVCPLRNGWHVG